MAVPKPPGRPPVPDSKRRRRNVPASYGLAEPVSGGVAGVQPRLGFRAHKLVRDMWRALAVSVEGRFYSHADWERARLEMFYANQLLTGERQLTPVAWSAVQSGLNELLISPADKRRAGIELKAAAADADEAAAAVQIAEYQARLTG